MLVLFDPGILRFLLIIILSSEIYYSVNCQKKEPVKKIKKSSLKKEKEAFLLKKKLHKLKFLTQKAVKRLSATSDYDQFNSDYLEHIMRVRVPGTVGHQEVQQFIIGTLKKFGWYVDLDEFTSLTPFGNKDFTNIIATLNPHAERRLAIAAHYDSKLLIPKSGKYFIAASDSAVPCAMMLDFAKLIADKSKELKRNLDEVSPMLLFLDGEEAFVEWSKQDSIYGSRHLAEVFSNQTHAVRTLPGVPVKFSESIDAFILLDLLGAPNPRIYDLYPQTSHLYERLHFVENSLKKEGIITNNFPYFAGKPNQPVYIEDDHVPFLERGIPVLHIIPIPFPKAWHKLEDDASSLDPPTIKNLLKIFRQFFLEYFHLS